MVDSDVDNSEPIDDGTAYFVRARGRIQGPFTVTQLKKLRQRGQFSRAQEVSIDQISWQSASTLEAVFAVPKKTTQVIFEKSRELIQQGEYATGASAEAPIPSSSGQPEWHYTIGEEQFGPIGLKQLRNLIIGGQVTEFDLAWKIGMPDWTPIAELSEFSAPRRERSPRDPSGITSAGKAYAGFWFRFFAFLIDGFVIGAASGVLTFLLAVIIGAAFQIAILDVSNSPEDAAANAALGMAFLLSWTAVVIANVIFQWLYFAMMESSSHHGTLGKMACGIIVVDESGKPVTFAQATGRYFAKIISNVTLGIGYLMCIWTKQEQCLHDKMASCLVLKK